MNGKCFACGWSTESFERYIAHDCGAPAVNWLPHLASDNCCDGCGVRLDPGADCGWCLVMAEAARLDEAK